MTKKNGLSSFQKEVKREQARTRKQAEDIGREFRDAGNELIFGGKKKAKRTKATTAKPRAIKTRAIKPRVTVRKLHSRYHLPSKGGAVLDNVKTLI